jgi:transposase
MLRHRLTDEQWLLISDLFPDPKRTGRPPRDRRTVMDGILWILHTGSPWRDLPEEFGPWRTAWDLFDKWNDAYLLELGHNGLRQPWTDSMNCLQSYDSRIGRSELIELILYFLQGFANSFKCFQFNIEPATP